MKWPPYKWRLWLQGMFRFLSYPVAFSGSLWMLMTVVNASEGFWSTREYGLVAAAFAMSGLALAVIRLGDGRSETDRKGKIVRQSSIKSGTLWLSAFALIMGALLAVSLVPANDSATDQDPGGSETPAGSGGTPAGQAATAQTDKAGN